MPVSLIASWLAATLGLATPPVGLPAEIARVRRFSARSGARLWRGYGTAPFEMLLIEPSGETLFCPAGPRSGFSPAGRDAATGCALQTRPRSGMPETLLAAMPLLGPPSTIVMGTPASTGRAPADWTRTVLHEHFHQWQSNLPDYYARVGALDLAGGDQTGMWMLNFAFPYDNAAVGRAYREAAAALADAVEARGSRDFPAAAARYAKARATFLGGVDARSARYIDFQLWQEGVARWTEIELGKSFPDAAIRDSARALEARTIAALRTADLARERRELAYSYGAAEAMLLQACDPGWRMRYVEVLGLTPLIAPALARCSAA